MYVKKQLILINIRAGASENSQNGVYNYVKKYNYTKNKNVKILTVVSDNVIYVKVVKFVN